MMDSRLMQTVVKVCSASAALLVLSNCGTMKRVVDAIPVPSMPKISLPKLSSVTKIIPGMGGEPEVHDPVMPFNSKGSLGYGHTVDCTTEPNEAILAKAAAAYQGREALKGEVAASLERGSEHPLGVAIRQLTHHRRVRSNEPVELFGLLCQPLIGLAAQVA